MSATWRFRTPTLSLLTLSGFFGALLWLVMPIQARIIVDPGMLGGEFWEYGTLSLFLSDGILFLYILSSLMAATEYCARRSLTTVLGCVALLILVSLSVDIADNQAVGFFALVTFALRGIALAMATLYSPAPKSSYMWGVIGSGIIQSTLALTQFFSQHVVAIPGLGMVDHAPEIIGAAVIQVADSRILRAYGTLPHPNILGGFLVVVLLSTLVLLSTSKTRERKIFLGCSVFLMSAGIWCSLSRQAWIALGITVTLFMTHLLFQRMSKKFLLFMFACVSIPFFVLTTTHQSLIKTRLFATERLESYSIQERQKFIEDTAHIIRENALLGIGIGQTTHYLFDRDQEHAAERAVALYQPVHNIPLLIWQETGVASLILYIALMIEALVLAWEQRHTTFNLFFLSLLALLCISFFDHYLWSLPFGITLFWFVFALAHSQPIYKNTA